MTLSNSRLGPEAGGILQQAEQREASRGPGPSSCLFLWAGGLACVAGGGARVMLLEPTQTQGVSCTLYGDSAAFKGMTGTQRVGTGRD